MNKPAPEVDLLVVNPFSSQTAWLLPQLANRIKLFASEVDRVPDSEAFTRRFLARMVLGDPNVRACVAVAGEDIVAHCIAEMVQVDDELVLFLVQLEVDPGFSKVIDKILAEGDNWAKSMNVQRMRLEATSSKDLQVWRKLYGKFGFTPVSYVMERPVNGS